MKVEIEARYCPIDIVAIESYLKNETNAVWCGEVCMDRVVYDINYNARTFLRLRRESNAETSTDLTTLTVKQIQDICSVTGTFEHEIKIEGDRLHEFQVMLQAIGLKQRSYQTNKRRQWRYKTSTISIDIWPKIKPLLEIESESYNELEHIAQELQLSNRFEGDIVELYCREMKISRDEFHKIEVLAF